MALVGVGVNVPVLNECMERENLTTTALANELGVHKATISRIRNHVILGSKEIIYALQERFPDRAHEMTVRHARPVEVTSTVSVESGTG